jgi:hypothetical protein
VGQKKSNILKNGVVFEPPGACESFALPFKLVPRDADENTAMNEGIDPVLRACEEGALPRRN